MATKLSELYSYIDSLEANGNSALDVAVLRAFVDEVEAEASGMIAEAPNRACEALREINKYNRLGNDLDAYLFAIAKWGLGEEADRPDPSDYIQ